MARSMAVQCPDCESICAISIVLLTSHQEIVYLTACAKCNDHKTIRVFHKLDEKTFIEASLRGMPIIEYGKHK